MTLEKALIEANSRLASQESKLRIEQRGRRLNLRGPLPLREDPCRTALQRISLGVIADATGLDQAFTTATLIQLQLNQGNFDWSNWSARSA